MNKRGVILLLIGGALTVALLFIASSNESPWRVSIDLTKWRGGSADGFEFDTDGSAMRRFQKHYVGPVTLTSKRVWQSVKPPAAPDTNTLIQTR
jgi:hypothetical protein